MSPSLSLVCVIAEASVIHEARVGSAAFLNSESPRNQDKAEKMLPVALSPTGALPATHFLCTRSMREDEIERQAKWITTTHLPVTAYVVDTEETLLETLGLKRVVS